MKKILLATGIICIVACVLLLLFSALELYTYNNLYDAPPAHYENLRHAMKVSFITGIVFAVAGVACVMIHLKK